MIIFREKLRTYNIPLLESYFKSSFDIEKHIANGLLSFCSAKHHKSSFGDYFIVEKIKHFEESHSLLSKFFSCLVEHVEKLDNPFDKEFYLLVFNIDIQQSILSKALKTFGSLSNESLPSFFGKKYFLITDIVPLLKNCLPLNDLLENELDLEITSSALNKLYLHKSSVRLISLKVFLKVHKIDVPRKLVIKGKKSIVFQDANEFGIEFHKLNKADNSEKDKQKGFSCFRFDFRAEREGSTRKEANIAREKVGNRSVDVGRRIIGKGKADMNRDLRTKTPDFKPNDKQVEEFRKRLGEIHGRNHKVVEV